MVSNEVDLSFPPIVPPLPPFRLRPASPIPSPPPPPTSRSTMEIKLLLSSCESSFSYAFSQYISPSPPFLVLLFFHRFGRFFFSPLLPFPYSDRKNVFSVHSRPRADHAWSFLLAGLLLPPPPAPLFTTSRRPKDGLCAFHRCPPAFDP